MGGRRAPLPCQPCRLQLLTIVFLLQLLLCIFTFAMVVVPAAKDQSKAAKGRRRGLVRAPTATPALTWTLDDPYTTMADYERSIQDMVRQLKNSSEPSDTKCQVNLRVWRSNRRSLSPWTYR